MTRLDTGPPNLKVRPVDTATREELRWHLKRVAASVVEDGKRIVVTHRGAPSFALVPLADLERLEKLDRAKKPRQ